MRCGYFEFGPEAMARWGAAYSLDLEQRILGTEGRSCLTSRWEAPRPRLTEAARERKARLTIYPWLNEGWITVDGDLLGTGGDMYVGEKRLGSGKSVGRRSSTRVWYVMVGAGQ